MELGLTVRVQGVTKAGPIESSSQISLHWVCQQEASRGTGDDEGPDCVEHTSSAQYTARHFFHVYLILGHIATT